MDLGDISVQILENSDSFGFRENINSFYSLYGKHWLGLSSWSRLTLYSGHADWTVGPSYAHARIKPLTRERETCLGDIAPSSAVIELCQTRLVIASPRPSSARVRGTLSTLFRFRCNYQQYTAPHISSPLKSQSSHRVYFRRAYLYNALFTHFTSAWTECTNQCMARRPGRPGESERANGGRYMKWKFSVLALSQSTNSSTWRAQNTRAYIEAKISKLDSARSTHTSLQL